MLGAIKTVHTIIWAFFVFLIGAIWWFALHANFAAASWAIGIVLLEVAVLGLNHGQCPLGTVVARCTDDRSANFDIYLPAWLAARTKSIFGTLYGAAILFTIVLWLGGVR
ncbi:hypothetical protein G4G27_06845 [Sphingomonas sp. So64.6b]|uniref:hypothetical protein n=1 Tax=Sphingomonas sp. So64.6b TaxID=2997354 RepID=UPI00160086E1|nr:hypothetical protein [Sphingomonas sp. So64.6b]QNA83737.1 hypothetical protein G4G27_06845 [Sphingomonas sp. So64.6b]